MFECIFIVLYFQTADRIMKDLWGSESSVQIIGNAPIGYYKYKYPKSVQASRSRIGAKVCIQLLIGFSTAINIHFCKCLRLLYFFKPIFTIICFIIHISSEVYVNS